RLAVHTALAALRLRGIRRFGRSNEKRSYGGHIWWPFGHTTGELGEAKIENGALRIQETHGVGPETGDSLGAVCQNAAEYLIINVFGTCGSVYKDHIAIKNKIDCFDAVFPSVSEILNKGL
ncbi:MAG TPA: hypothetical protein VGJ02_10385, partial [Pyrinomonadaceae bacterium]